jgi:hypothetical protein
LDAGGHFVQFFQHCVLAFRDAMHPPKANDPAGHAGPGERQNDHLSYIARLAPLVSSATVGWGDSFDFAQGKTFAQGPLSIARRNESKANVSFPLPWEQRGED